MDIINPFTLWVLGNPVLSGLIAFIAALLGIYFKTAIQTVAKHHTDKLINKPQQNEDVVDEPTSALISNRTNEDYQGLTSKELIEFYEVNEPAYRITIGNKAWVFAACREIDPVGIGIIADQKIKLQYHAEWFELDHELDSLTNERFEALNAASKSEKLFNGDPFQIRSISAGKGFTKIEVGRCKYFDSLRTSYSLDFVLPERGQTLRDVLHKNTNSFGSFEQSRLPNHMGLVVIIETRDGQLVIQKRSQNVQIRQGTLSASVSGTFEKGDLENQNGAFPLSKALKGVVREMHGELGGKYSSDISNLYFMGLMREFRRGGFPDFYFYYESPLSFNELKANSFEAEETFEIDSLEGVYIGSKAYLSDPADGQSAFDGRINDLLKNNEGRANLTLNLGIGLYYEMIGRRANSP